MFNICLFMIGFILATIGLFFITLYLNLLIVGYSFFEFVYFIIRSIYCNLFFIGIILIILSLGRNKQNGLLL